MRGYTLFIDGSGIAYIDVLLKIDTHRKSGQQKPGKSGKSAYSAPAGLKTSRHHAS
tara:strand:- start:1902 stop:2069 length:168 start_codon:yes stop_codon:yes gene_type:complete